MYTYIHIHESTHTHIHGHITTHASTRRRMYTCTHTHTHIYMYACLTSRTHTRAHAYTQTKTCSLPHCVSLSSVCLYLSLHTKYRRCLPNQNVSFSLFPSHPSVARAPSIFLFSWTHSLYLFFLSLICRTCTPARARCLSSARACALSLPHTRFLCVIPSRSLSIPLHHQVPPTLSLSLFSPPCLSSSVSVFLSLSHTHTHAHTRAPTRFLSFSRHTPPSCKRVHPSNLALLCE